MFLKRICEISELESDPIDHCMGFLFQKLIKKSITPVRAQERTQNSKLRYDHRTKGLDGGVSCGLALFHQLGKHYEASKTSKRKSGFEESKSMDAVTDNLRNKVKNNKHARSHMRMHGCTNQLLSEQHRYNYIYVVHLLHIYIYYRY